MTGLPIVVATSETAEDDLIEFETLSHPGVNVFRGSLENVRNRFFVCAAEYNFDVIVRVTSDNPFTEPSFVTRALKKINEGAHYARANPNLCPDGSNIEAFRFSELQISETRDSAAANISDVEHVTPEIIQRLQHSNLFSEFSPSPELGTLDSDIHIGVDTLSDYVKIRRIYQDLGDIKGFENDLLARVVAMFKLRPNHFQRGRRHGV